MANAIRDIGALAGLGSFLGLAVLSLLYFSQARDVRRLREWAGRAPERDAQEVEATSDLAAERAEELRKVEEERRAREEASTAEQAAEEHRELRRQRREAGLPEETRWERLKGRFGRGPSAAVASGTGRRISTTTVAIIVAVVILLAGGALIAAGVFSSGGGSQSSKHGLLKPSQLQVDVLNATNPPVNGLAGLFSDKIESKGYKSGHVGDSNASFAQSAVMFKGGFRPEAAKLARQLNIKKVQTMTQAIRSDSKTGNPLAVVVGQDKANFSG